MNLAYGSDYGYRKVTDLFEGLARETWDFLLLGSKYACVPSEETITDRHLLQMAAAELSFLKVFKATKNLEGRCGFDWEWWIGGRHSGWIRYAIQAKKINMRTFHYSGIKQTVRGKPQIEILKDFARAQRATPLYCFYNSKLEQGRACWHCDEPYDEKQLGCVLVPLEDVEESLRQGGTKYLNVLFLRRSIPWRCLFRCNRERTYFPFHEVPHFWRPEKPALYVYEQMPKGVGDVLGSPELYDSALGGYPKRVVTLDTWEMFGNE